MCVCVLFQIHASLVAAVLVVAWGVLCVCGCRRSSLLVVAHHVIQPISYFLCHIRALPHATIVRQVLLPEMVEVGFIFPCHLQGNGSEREDTGLWHSVFKHHLVTIARHEEHVVYHGADLIAEQWNFRRAEFALVVLVGNRHPDRRLADFLDVLGGFGIQDELLHASQERRDFVKHSPEKVSVWRHPPDSLNEVTVPVPKIESDGTITPSEPGIEAAQMGDRQVKALNPRRIDRFLAGSKRVFRVVCPADGTEAILRDTGAVSVSDHTNT